MATLFSRRMQSLLTVVVALLIVRVTVEVVMGYVNYFPPNFSADFLHGRQATFARYRWSFYPHIVSGPFALFGGLVLMSEQFRMRLPRWHRWIGRLHVVNVLLVILSSGFVMGFDAAAGWPATVSFVLLTMATAVSTAMGWRTAVQRRFADHRCWMQRSYVLLCSAVVLRILGGLGTMLEVSWLWYDVVITWASWVTPLVVYEIGRNVSWKRSSLSSE